MVPNYFVGVKVEEEYMQNLKKLCALCETGIGAYDIVCKEHIAELELYEKESWFQALVEAQQRQYEIDTAQQRAFVFGVSIDHKSTKPYVKLTKTNIKDIHALVKQGLGWRRIARQLQLNPRTVNKFIYRMRNRGRQLN